MNLTKGAPALNYRLGVVDRIAQLGTNKATGEIEKVKTVSGKIWDATDLQPQGSIFAPLTQTFFDVLLHLIRECAFSESSTAADGLDGLALLALLTQEQKRQVWGQLGPEEKRHLTQLRKKENQTNAA